MVDLDALRNEIRERKSPRCSVLSQDRTTVSDDSLQGNSNDGDYHYHLGKCYDEGIEGYEVNAEKAMLEYLAAAEAGHAGAMTEVSSDYSNSEDSILGYNLAEAEKWATKAIELGNADGYKELFDVLEEKGEGEEAIKQLEIGASQGSKDCIEWLAFLLSIGGEVAGYEVVEDEERAFRLLTSFEWDDNNLIALETLGNLYYDREEYGLAVSYYEKLLLAQPANYTAMSVLASMLRCQKGQRDLPRARELYEVAAENGEASAMNGLGVMLYLGEGSEPDEQSAIEWFRKSARLGYHRAMINLFDILPDDNTEGLYWLRRASDEGNEEATARLKEFEERGQGIAVFSNKGVANSVISNKVKRLIADKLGFDMDDVHYESRLVNDLGADSLDSIELLMEFEKEFGLDIPDKDMKEIQTVGDVINYIDSRT